MNAPGRPERQLHDLDFLRGQAGLVPCLRCKAMISGERFDELCPGNGAEDSPTTTEAIHGGS